MAFRLLKQTKEENRKIYGAFLAPFHNNQISPMKTSDELKTNQTKRSTA